MSNSLWGILAFRDGQYKTLHENGTSFTENIFEAKTFETKEAAKAYASQINTPTLVQILVGVNSRPTVTIPHPDFYESGNEYMELVDLIEQISSDDLTGNFTPVDKITGGQQMTGSAIVDPIDGKIIGRELQFSFSKLLKDNDMVDLRDALSQDKRYVSAGYTIRRLGFTAYAVLTLRVSRQ